MRSAGERGEASGGSCGSDRLAASGALDSVAAVCGRLLGGGTLAILPSLRICARVRVGTERSGTALGR